MFLGFATGPEGEWRSNFRDFAGCLRRMATLSEGSRISIALVQEEILRLQTQWARLSQEGGDRGQRVVQVLANRELDLFDMAQLEQVLTVVQAAPSQAEAGRRLFAVSREERSSQNDGDRLRKYLARFDLDWHGVRRVLGVQKA